MNSAYVSFQQRECFEGGGGRNLCLFQKYTFGWGNCWGIATLMFYQHARMALEGRRAYGPTMQKNSSNGAGAECKLLTSWSIKAHEQKEKMKEIMFLSFLILNIVEFLNVSNFDQTGYAYLLSWGHFHGCPVIKPQL